MVVYDFIEIGTADFDTEIEKAGPTTVGLTIEPLRHYLDALPCKEHVTKVNAAISNYTGTIKLYSVYPETIQTYQLPWYARGCNSVGTYHPTIANHVLSRGLKLEDVYTVDEVPVLDWNTLLKNYSIEGVKYLKVDTEGHDTIIVNNFLDSISPEFQLPNRILFESNCLSKKEDIDALIERLMRKGYMLIYRNPENDTLMQLIE
jgi:hypothetical protein